MYLRLTALFLLAGILAAAATGASAPEPAVASAAAEGISVVVPGQAPTAGARVAAPGPVGIAVADSFAYPADGSIVRTGALSSSVSTRATGVVGAQAVADVLAVSVFNGEITAESVAARAKASAEGADAVGSGVTNLVVLGTAVVAAPNLRVPLGDWGYLVVLEQVAEVATTDGTKNARGAVDVLRVVLTADHGGLPAGSEIVVGRAEGAASTPLPRPPAQTDTEPAVTEPKPPAPTRPRTKPRPRVPGTRDEPGAGKPIPRLPPRDLVVPLSPNGYVFPIFGDASFGDSWGAPRATTGRHQGTDIFAPLGAPVLAVADGTLFSVGWNRIGGWRLWLRDRQGNQFYYAHMAAYAVGTRDGAEVKAGQVVGFNGNSGDAQGTPFHVHFEIHPVGLLPLGYEGGAVNPFLYLDAWRRVEDVSFAIGRGWAPPVPASSRAPRPAAVLLGASDISSVSGLEPGSLERALTAPVLNQG